MLSKLVCGFANRTDRSDVQANVRYLENRPGALLRQSSTFASVRSEHNFAGEPILTIANVNFHAQTLEYWRMNAGMRD